MTATRTRPYAPTITTIGGAPDVDSVSEAETSTADRALVATVFLLGACHSQTLVPIAAPASFVLFVIAAGRRGFRFTLHAAVGLVLAVYLLALAGLNGNLDGVHPVTFVLDFGPALYALTLLALLLSVNWRREEAAKILSAGLAGVAAVTLVGFVADLAGMRLLGETLSIKGRFEGLLSGPNALAGSAGSALLLAASQAVLPSNATPRWVRWVAAALGAAFLAAVSRGYTLGLLAAGGFMIVTVRGQFRRPSRLVLALLTVGVLLPLVTFQLADRIDGSSEDASVSTRFLLFDRAFDLWSESPLTGIGIGTFEQRNVDLDAVVPGLASLRIQGDYQRELVRFDAEGGQHTHNVVLQTLVDGGLIGLAMIGFLLVAAWRAAADAANDWLHLYTRVSLVFLLVSGFTGGLTLYSASIATLPFLAFAFVLRSAPSASPLS